MLTISALPLCVHMQLWQSDADSAAVRVSSTPAATGTPLDVPAGRSDVAGTGGASRLTTAVWQADMHSKPSQELPLSSPSRVHSLPGRLPWPAIQAQPTSAGSAASGQPAHGETAARSEPDSSLNWDRQQGFEASAISNGPMSEPGKAAGSPGGQRQLPQRLQSDASGSGWGARPGQAAALSGSLQEPLQQQQGEVVSLPGSVTAQERESDRQKPSLPSWLLEELGTPAAGRLPIPNDSGTQRPAADRLPTGAEAASAPLKPGSMSALPAWLSGEAGHRSGASPSEAAEREPGQATAGSMRNGLQMRPDSDSSQDGSHNSSHEPVVVANGDGPSRLDKPTAGQLRLVLVCRFLPGIWGALGSRSSPALPGVGGLS